MADHLHALAVPYSRPGTPGAHSPVQIGFIGLGSMGYYMARNIARRPTPPGFPPLPLMVWNRSAEKSQKLENEVGKGQVAVAKDLEEIATKCDIIITNLANDAVVKDVYEQCARFLRLAPSAKNKIFVETSTILPHLAGELDVLVSGLAHSHFISCPVFGRPVVADKAQLLLVMAGDYRSKKEVAYLLVPSMGRKVLDLGENVEKAPTFKLLGNSMILGTMEVLAEAYTLGDKAGIEAERIHELVGDILPAPGIIGYSERMAHDDFNGVGGFSLEGGIKDASHMRRLTTQYDAPMPTIDIAHQRLITARALHTSQQQEGKQTPDILDWTALIAGSRVAAGLDAFDSTKHKNRVEEE